MRYALSPTTVRTICLADVRYLRRAASRSDCRESCGSCVAAARPAQALLRRKLVSVLRVSRSGSGSVHQLHPRTHLRRGSVCHLRTMAHPTGVPRGESSQTPGNERWSGRAWLRWSCFRLGRFEWAGVPTRRKTRNDLAFRIIALSWLEGLRFRNRPGRAEDQSRKSAAPSAASPPASGRRPRGWVGTVIAACSLPSSPSSEIGPSRAPFDPCSIGARGD